MKPAPYPDTLVRLALTFVRRRPPAAVRDTLGRWIEEELAELKAPQRTAIQEAVAKLAKRPRQKPPSELLAWLRESLGIRALREKTGVDQPSPIFLEWIRSLAPDEKGKVFEASIRLGLNLGTRSDEELFHNTLANRFAGKEDKMANFIFDGRGLPPNFAQQAFAQAVSDELQNNLGLPLQNNEVVHAAITGMLLLDEHFNPAGFGFPEAVHRAWLESVKKTVDVNGQPQPSRKVYEAVAAAIEDITGNPAIPYQELASVSRYVLANAAEVPLGHRNFRTQVRLGLDRYVAGAPPADSLELPPLQGVDGRDVEILPDNIRAVAMIYTAHQLEEMRLFHVVDRITELFINGSLPVVFDDGGRALDKFHWDREDRLTEPERRMQYSRVLGVPGGDVSRETLPNSQFENLLLRFLSSVSEYDRQRRIAGLFDQIQGGARRSLSMTVEQVRQTGRDMAANTTLYGYAYTHFAARRLRQHITTALDILKLPQILKAYSATNPFQVIERVAPDFGAIPNIVQRRTMAESGNVILNLIAKYPGAWTNGIDAPLFAQPGVNKQPAIGTDDEEKFIRHTQLWLAVNGVKDDQVDQYSQPAISVYSPSVPAQPARGVNGKLEQLRNMVSEGNVPSLADLQTLLPTIG